MSTLTERQQREIEYHQEHARLRKARYESISYELVQSPHRRWWNQVWVMYDKVLELELSGKKVLVVGCGFGDDAFLIAKTGAEVYAFDISPDVLEVAERVSQRENLSVRFARMTAENLDYPDGFFDCVLIRDILHHVEIPQALAEITRVSSDRAMVIINEVYTHSALDRIRHSRFVQRYIHRRAQAIVYGGERPYITEDERKLNERDLDMVMQAIDTPAYVRYFEFLVNRVIPVRYKTSSQIESIFLRIVGSLGRYLAGRVLIVGHLSKAK